MAIVPDKSGNGRGGDPHIMTPQDKDDAADMQKSGGTFTGKVSTPPSTAANAGLNIGVGTVPSAPVDGDMWLVASGALLSYRISSTTYSAVNDGTTQTIGGVKTFSQKTTHRTSNAGAASLLMPHGVAPTSPVDGDMWTTSAGLFIRINGVTKSVNLT